MRSLTLGSLIPSALFVVCVVSSPPSRLQAEPSFKTPVTYEDADRRAGEILAKMKVDEKVQLITGSNGFYIKGFPQYGMPDLFMSDATAGVHIRNNLPQHMEKSTAFPVPIGLAATWNPGLAYAYAHSVGEECRAGGIAFLLGPGMDVYRISQCGRNFEYFGEDPFLASRMIERYVAGVLDTGTIPTLKHFIANETDYFRRTSNSIVDERTLHEINLPPFKAGIAAGAMAVMTSYNQLNGEYSGQSEYAIKGLLRKELGYRWLVMTDWWSVWDAEKIMNSGQDLEMPGEKYLKADALRLVTEGRVPMAELDRMCREIIRTCIAMGLYDRPVKDEYFLKTLPQHKEVARQTGRESVVLLKNDGILPVRKDSAKKILLTGIFVEQLARGGGSADVDGYDVVTLLQALHDMYGSQIEYVKTPTDDQLRKADLVFLSTGTFDSEGWDHTFSLPDKDEQAVRHTVELNPHTVVIVNSGGGINMSAWNDRAAAIVYAWYPGQEGNRGLAEVLSGETSPSGKLPFTIEKRFEDSPGYGYTPANEKLYTGWEQDNNMSHPINNIIYKEGVFVGYRWYEAKKIAPLYAFGHGLSYTKFEYSKLSVSPTAIRPDGRVAVEVLVKNVGSTAGAEIVQVYAHEKNAPLPRPEKELKGFAKVTLKPGESQVVRVRIEASDLGYWDVKTHGWMTDSGDYDFDIAAASDDVRLHGSVHVD
jgi:beta-glucosidase